MSKNVKDLYDLKGKVALVTGGNRGIGFGCALALAQAGANIAIMARNEEACKKAVKEIEQENVKVDYFLGDVTNYDDAQTTVDSIIDKFGKIDILVNNAGTVKNIPAEEMSLDDWNYVMNVNLNSVFIMSQAVGRQMIKQGDGGSIMSISSMSADIVNEPQPQCSYNASKAGINHLTKSLAYEWVKYNIRVNAIAPGYIMTDLLRPGMGSEWFKHWVDVTPMKRVGEPYEIGALAVYLASDASTYTTGSIIRVDGGYTLI